MNKTWRKLKKSATTARKTYQQPWPTLSLTSKQKKMYRRSSKVYAAEIGRTVKKSALFQSYNSGWGHAKVTTPWVSTRERGSLLSKRLWFLDNPAAVPGVAPMKKRRSLYAAKLRAWRTFHFWLGDTQKKVVQKRMINTASSYSLLGWWSLVQLLETTGLSLLQKIGWSFTTMMARSWTRRQWLSLNGGAYSSHLIYVRPGDILNCNWKAQQKWRTFLSFLQFPLNGFFTGKKPYIFTSKNKKPSKKWMAKKSLS